MHRKQPWHLAWW